MSITELHHAARNFALAGIPVFPCQPGSKAPATSRGFHDASADLDQIDAWWKENPNYNVAFCPHQVGWGIVDIDGPEGEAAWAKLKIEDKVPDTYEVATPRGGRHLYFDGELPMTAWRPGVKRALGEHIDTRGIGSYVLAPPSVINTYKDDEAQFNGAKYEVLRDRPFATVPRTFTERLRVRDDAAKATVGQLDLPGNIDRAKHHLASLLRRGDVAYSGRAGNNRTYQLACELLNLGLSSQVCGELLIDNWNDHCVPPWPRDELVAIVDNAASYAQNEAGAWGVPPAEEVFGSVLDQLADLPPERKEARSRFYFEDEAEQETAKDTPWLIPQLIPDASTVLIVGPKGNFKSFIAHELALATAAGVPTFQTQALRSGPVFYGTHEGAAELKRARRRAWRLARGIDRAIPIFVAPAPRIASQEECDEFREQIRKRLRESTQRIAGIVLDTVAKCMAGLDENSAADMGLFVAFCDLLAYEFQCPIIALHHTKKDGSAGSRGSGALEAGFSTVIDVQRQGKTKLVSVSVRYHKDAEEPEKPWTFEGRVVGPSLVFFPISGVDFKSATMEDDPFDRRKVGASLRDLQAVGESSGVSTDVLAGQMTPTHENESIEGRAEAVKKSARILNALSRTKLAAYCARPGRHLVWSLPSAGADQDAEPE